MVSQLPGGASTLKPPQLTSFDNLPLNPSSSNPPNPPGCYPLVMPFVSAVTAAKWQLATSQNSIEVTDQFAQL